MKLRDMQHSMSYCYSIELERLLGQTVYDNINMIGRGHITCVTILFDRICETNVLEGLGKANASKMLTDGGTHPLVRYGWGWTSPLPSLTDYPHRIDVFWT